jgi:two-component system sensor histidine kinase CssS
MRIWATFAVIIFIICLATSLAYAVIYRSVSKMTKEQDLLLAHKMILHNNFIEPFRFDALENLKHSQHFFYSVGRTFDIPAGKPNKPAFQASAPMDALALKNWLVNQIHEDAEGKIRAAKFLGTRYLFIVSRVDDGFFVSYRPDTYELRMVYYIFLVGLIFTLLGFVAAKIVASHISEPLLRLERYTERIAAKDWKEPIQLENRDEIGRLAEAMNQMRGALKRADEEEKLFLQTISHDLKTPVMVIMSHADAILDGVYVDTLDKTARIIKDESIRLDRKIRRLLYLNTLNYTLENQSEITDVALDELLRDLAQRFQAPGANFSWELDLFPATVRGNWDKLHVAFENILDNAIRYTKTKILIRMKNNTKGNAKQIAVEIENDGAPIPPDALDRIFENMYKDRTGNFGLGLAITRTIIIFFGGSVYAQNTSDGVRFVVSL